MALEIHLVPSPCVTWKTALPRAEGTPYIDSVSFRLKESDAMFRIYGYTDRHDIYIHTKQQLGKAYVVISIERENGKYCRLFSGEKQFSYEPLTLGGDANSVFYQTLIYTIRSEIGISVDNVSLVFVFHFDEPSTCSKAIKAPEQPSIQPSCLQTLSEDMEKIFDKEKHSDVVLKCGDRRFSVNKNILSARSEVFAAMFRNKMSENETGLVDIEDMEADVLEQFLRYVYSGKLNSLTLDSVCDLYRVGDKYAVSSLVRKCASFMVDNLSGKNVCQVLSLADTFGDTELSDLAERFAVNRDGFLKSEEWNDFATAHPAMAVGVYKKFVMK